jgi:Zn-dependent protease with chaperone function
VRPRICAGTAAGDSMGYLIQILLALPIQALAEEGLRIEGELPFVVLLLAAVPYVLAALARRASLQGRFTRADRLLTLLWGAPVGLHAIALLVCGWLQTLVGYTLLAIDARARALSTRTEEVVRAWRFQGRMLLSSIAPLVLYVLIAWGLGRFEGVRARIDHVQLFGALFAGALMLGFLAFLPFLLQRTWDTQPLPPGPLRDLLEAQARAAGFRCRDILVWRTESQMANAAVVGIAPRLRVVLLSDALLSQLLPRETLAVFAHEVGHARRHHVLVFVAWSVAFFLFVDLATLSWLPDDALAAGAVLGPALAAWYLGFGWLSRRFELDADLFSVELLGDEQPMIGALEAVGGPHGYTRRTWRHFSTSDRVAFLRRLPLEPELGEELRRRLRRFAWAGLVLAALAVLGETVALSAAYPAESVRVELALGRYDRARERLDALAHPDPDLARQVRLGAELATPQGTIPRPALVEAARAQLGRGDLTGALDLLELAMLRGASRLDAIATTLLELDPDAPPDAWGEAADRLAHSDPAWALALREGARQARD